jgi:benzoylformate decarboxylase
MQSLVGVDLPDIDFVALAIGHGCEGTRVENGTDLRSTLEHAMRSERPCLVEVVVD